MLVFHFSRLIRLMAHFSFLDLQKAEWTTAVAPTPVQNKSKTMVSLISVTDMHKTTPKIRLLQTFYLFLFFGSIKPKFTTMILCCL